MFVNEEKYEIIVAFLTGYLTCQSTTSELSIDKYFQRWLEIKVGEHFASHWSSMILHYCKDTNFENPINRLYAYFDMFFEYTDKHPEFLSQNL